MVCDRADGGLYTSPEDWNKFQTSLLYKGVELMSEKTWELMIAPATPDLSDPAFNTHMTDALPGPDPLRPMPHSTMAQLLGPNTAVSNGIAQHSFPACC